jgi:putative tricarboxylic transport membrane protein
VPWWAAILRVPFSIVGPIIVVVCSIGAYTVHNAFFDIVLMLVFGIVGYIFKKLQYPLAPLVLALVLGDMAESAFRQSMILSGGELSIFWSNGLVATICALAIFVLFWPQIADGIARLAGGRTTGRDSAD